MSCCCPLTGRISLQPTMRFMRHLMLWDYRRTFLGVFMLMVLRSPLQSSKG